MAGSAAARRSGVNGTTSKGSGSAANGAGPKSRRSLLGGMRAVFSACKRICCLNYCSSSPKATTTTTLTTTTVPSKAVQDPRRPHRSREARNGRRITKQRHDDYAWSEYGIVDMPDVPDIYHIFIPRIREISYTIVPWVRVYDQRHDDNALGDSPMTAGAEAVAAAAMTGSSTAATMVEEELVSWQVQGFLAPAHDRNRRQAMRGDCSQDANTFLKTLDYNRQAAGSRVVVACKGAVSVAQPAVAVAVNNGLPTTSSPRSSVEVEATMRPAIRGVERNSLPATLQDVCEAAAWPAAVVAAAAGPRLPRRWGGTTAPIIVDVEQIANDVDGDTAAEPEAQPAASSSSSDGNRRLDAVRHCACLPDLKDSGGSSRGGDISVTLNGMLLGEAVEPGPAYVQPLETASGAVRSRRSASS
ncbi:hypothetical protein PLESTF_001697700 [Pleodorina starrii]|nr:hypothetical protein PLESTM_000788000 [Pleodorina starrii]GLC75864.1 hypothetical protein PLESTF_001697700 [Pleodorina starrii]